MKKRSLLLCLALVLSMTVAIGGTLAYLTDTETTTNVMVVGNVDIDQLENGLSEGGFADGQPLYPAVVEKDTAGNVTSVVGSIAKEVTVKNTGSSSAYVRTVVAFPYVGGQPVHQDSGLLEVQTGFEPAAIVDDVDIDGMKHSLWVFVYSDALAAGETTAPSLVSFYMSPEATNEDMTENGLYPVLVASQAVQTENMSGAEQALNLGFGAISATNHPWTNGSGFTVIKTQAELETALKDKSISEVYLAAGTYTIPNGSIGSGHDLTVIGSTDGVIVDETGLGNEFYGGNIVFKNVTIRFPSTSHRGFTHTKSVKYFDCTFEGTQTLYAPTEYTDCTFNVTGNNYAVWTYGCNASFTNCTFNTDGKAILVYHEGVHTSDIRLTDCTFIDNGSIDGKAAVEIGNDRLNTPPTITLTFTDCSIAGFDVNKNGTTTGTPFYGNKDSIPDENLKVTINGVATLVPKQEEPMKQADLQAALNQGGVINFDGNTSESLYYANLPSNGTIKNLNFAGKNMVIVGDKGYYGNYGMRMDGGITFEGCSFGGVYALNISDGNGEAGTANFTDCNFNGWISFAANKVTSATFVNCTFDSNADPAQEGFINCYQDMTFINCTFKDGFKGIDDELVGDQTVIFTNCTGVKKEWLNATGTCKTITFIEN